MRPIDQNAMDAILRYVNDYYRENHTSPTIRQISEATGVSKSKTQRCVVDMKERGIFEYGWNVFAPEDKITLRKMADCMGVSHQALVIRLKTLKLLIPHDLTEYLEKGLQLGGAQ